MYVCAPEDNFKFNQLRVRFSSYLTFGEIIRLISKVLLLYMSGGLNDTDDVTFFFFLNTGNANDDSGKVELWKFDRRCSTVHS